MASLWLDTAPTIGFDEAGRRDADVVVVGAGITGLMTAALLAGRGARVVVLEAREVVGAVATGNTTAKVSLLQSDRLHRALGLARREAVEAFVEGSIAGQLRLRGLLAARGTPAEERTAISFAFTSEGVASLEREVEAARGLGIPVESSGAESLPFRVAGAIQLIEQAQVQPVAMLGALAAELREHGGRIVRAEVRSVRTVGRGVELETDAGSWRASAAVLATGSPVPARATSALLTATRSYAAAYRTAAPLPEPMAISVDSPSRSIRTAAGPDGDVLVAGGPAHAVGRHADPRRLVAELDDWVRSHWPDAERTHVWSAQDYATPDRLPWIGARPGSRGRVLLATGFDKWGMSSGAMSAIALAGRIAGEEPDWARTLRRRGTTIPALGKAAGAFGAVVAADARATASALQPASAPAEGQGELGREGLRLVATSTVDGETRRVSAHCPHVGALVAWNAQDRSWDCVAHGSRFAPDGSRLEGPADCPLRALRRAPREREPVAG